MTLHVVSLPHTQLTKAYSTCAYTQKVRKFCDMMTKLGHKVYVYASEENDTQASLITCITKKQQSEYGFNGPEDYLKIDFNSPDPWSTFNKNVIKNMKYLVQPKDIICLITPCLDISQAFPFPGNITVEFGVGYSGVRHDFRVFESYAWRNFVYGKYDWDGQFYDEVIPNYFEVEDFPVQTKKEDYYLYIGRLTGKKGWKIAQDVCEKLGKRLVVAGPGEFFGYGEYVGVVGPGERAKLMGGALAVFVPSLYVPPFEGVHIEAMLCGTPVITTDFGVFSETVDNGWNGYRCKTFEDFVYAAQAVTVFSKSILEAIHRNAANTYSTDMVAIQYQEYFERLLTLHDKGWYT